MLYVRPRTPQRFPDSSQRNGTPSVINSAVPVGTPKRRSSWAFRPSSRCRLRPKPAERIAPMRPYQKHPHQKEKNAARCSVIARRVSRRTGSRLEEKFTKSFVSVGETLRSAHPNARTSLHAARQSQVYRYGCRSFDKPYCPAPPVEGIHYLTVTVWVELMSPWWPVRRTPASCCKASAHSSRFSTLSVTHAQQVNVSRIQP